nr:hypothetical protein Iba_contig599CG0050 [Ipomoea batatas]GME02354.1 hypothetical protein Iba_contig4634CG0010 [Ipomoea batatas]
MGDWHGEIGGVELGKMDLLRQETILDVKALKDPLQLKNQLCYAIVPIPIVLMCDYCLHWSVDVNVEIDGIAHLRASVEVADGLCDQNRVREEELGDDEGDNLGGC